MGDDADKRGLGTVERHASVMRGIHDLLMGVEASLDERLVVIEQTQDAQIAANHVLSDKLRAAERRADGFRDALCEALESQGHEVPAGYWSDETQAVID